MWQVKNAAPWARKVARRSLLLAGMATLFVPLALAPADAQVSIRIGVGSSPPMCPYGYYNYQPYGCAPSGYYGSGYFYNGIFLGVGPWSNWGYGHGWGGHRFDGPGGGRYIVGARGYRRQEGYVEHRGRGPYEPRGGHDNRDHRDAHQGGGHAPAPHRDDSHGHAHDAPKHDGGHGGEPHGGGDHHQ